MAASWFAMFCCWTARRSGCGPPTPEDFDDIVAFYDGLSTESRYLRFHGFGRTDLAARVADRGDGARSSRADRPAGRDGWSPSLSTTCCASRAWPRSRSRWPKTSAAAAPPRGCSSSWRRSAAERGIRRFDAEVLASNRPMLQGVRARRIRRPARGRLRRAHRLARHHPERVGSRSDRRARPPCRRRVSAPDPRAGVGGGRRRSVRPRPARAREHPAPAASAAR